MQESIRKKRLANMGWDMQRGEERKQDKKRRREAKYGVSKAKNKAYDELYEETPSWKGGTTGQGRTER